MAYSPLPFSARTIHSVIETPSIFGRPFRKEPALPPSCLYARERFPLSPAYHLLTLAHREDFFPIGPEPPKKRPVLIPGLSFPPLPPAPVFRCFQKHACSNVSSGSNVLFISPVSLVQPSVPLTVNDPALKRPHGPQAEIPPSEGRTSGQAASLSTVSIHLLHPPFSPRIRSLRFYQSRGSRPSCFACFFFSPVPSVPPPNAPFGGRIYLLIEGLFPAHLQFPVEPFCFLFCQRLTSDNQHDRFGFLGALFSATSFRFRFPALHDFASLPPPPLQAFVSLKQCYLVRVIRNRPTGDPQADGPPLVPLCSFFSHPVWTRPLLRWGSHSSARCWTIPAFSEIPRLRMNFSLL